ncbi:hypothetical protein VULLAG_LOCUS1755 [Vulpes lagopus]
MGSRAVSSRLRRSAARSEADNLCEDSVSRSNNCETVYGAGFDAASSMVRAGNALTPTVSGSAHSPEAEGDTGWLPGSGCRFSQQGQDRKQLDPWPRGTGPTPRASSQRKAHAHADACLPPAEALTLGCSPLSLKLPEN